MPEYKLDRPLPPERAVASLPRGVSEWQVRLFVHLGRGAAGCIVCDRQVPAGASRVTLVLKLVEPVTNPKTGRTRRTERYAMHPGCLLKSMGGELKREGDACWDCGRPRRVEEFDVDDDDEAEVPAFQYIPFHRCFTVSKFAPGLLCESCTAKPYWSQCHLCAVWFPHWMVSPLVSDPRESCEYCADRNGLRTNNQEAEDRQRFEQLRRQVLEHGIFAEMDE